MIRLSEKFERVFFLVLGLVMCGIEAWRPFPTPGRHIIVEVLAGLFSATVGFLIGCDVKTWGLSEVASWMENTKQEIDELKAQRSDEEHALEREMNEHEETIDVLRAILEPSHPLEAARNYLKALEKKRYETEPEEDPDKGEVH